MKILKVIFIIVLLSSTSFVVGSPVEREMEKVPMPILLIDLNFGKKANDTPFTSEFNKVDNLLKKSSSDSDQNVILSSKAGESEENKENTQTTPTTPSNVKDGSPITFSPYDLLPFLNIPILGPLIFVLFSFGLINFTLTSVSAGDIKRKLMDQEDVLANINNLSPATTAESRNDDDDKIYGPHSTEFSQENEQISFESDEKGKTKKKLEKQKYMNGELQHKIGDGNFQKNYQIISYKRPSWLSSIILSGIAAAIRFWEE